MASVGGDVVEDDRDGYGVERTGSRQRIAVKLRKQGGVATCPEERERDSRPRHDGLDVGAFGEMQFLFFLGGGHFYVHGKFALVA
jgi:hypothetical protein